MTEIISKPFYSTLMQFVEKSKESIKLCAPFIKKEVVSDIFASKSKQASLELITKLDLKGFHQKSSDVAAIEQTIDSGGKVYNCSNLHAKVYIFDNRDCVITSANLTLSGLKRNEECGVMTNEVTLVRSAVARYSEIINREDVSTISPKQVSEIKVILEKLPTSRKLVYPKLGNTKEAQVGGDPNIQAISESLTGNWRKMVFLALGDYEEVFTGKDIQVMAEKLKSRFPNNNNREAKIRQVLQELRDLGLVEFVERGIYKKLWV